MKGTICAAISLTILTVGCENTAPGTGRASDDLNAPLLELAVKGAIGLEMGPPEEVFGAVEGVVTGPDGNIAVLDRAACCIRVYTPEGEFLRQISREGNGPGELAGNAFLTITERGVLALTGEGSEILGVHFFDYATGEWLGSEPSFGSPPTCLEGASGNTYMRKNLDLDQSSGEPEIVITVTLDSVGSDQPLLTFLEERVPFDPGDMASMVSLVWFGYDMACDYDGHYYISPRSSTDARVFAYDSLGAESFTIELDLEPVLRTPEELETERLILTAKASVMGDDIPSLEPDPYKPMIRGLEVDEEGNLWVLLGGPVSPEFLVFDPSGELHARATVETDRTDGSSWNFSFKGGNITAWAEEPQEGFQQIWLLSPLE